MDYVVVDLSYVVVDLSMENAFGIWEMENGDGLAFQTALRDEWPE